MRSAQPDHFPFGQWSMYLLIVGLLGPFLIALLALLLIGDEEAVAPWLLAAWFGLLALLVAFVLGVAGRDSREGRVGMFASGTILALTVLAGVAWWLSGAYSWSARTNRRSYRSPAPLRRIVPWEL